MRVAAIGRNKPQMVLTPGGKLLTLLAALSPRLTDKLLKIYMGKLLRPRKKK